VAEGFVPAAGGRRLGWTATGLALAAVLLLLLVGVPLTRLFATAVEDGVGTTWRSLGKAGTGQAVFNTVWTSLAVTILAVAAGTAAAVITESSRAPGRRWLRAAMLAALLSAPLVSALGWARAYGRGGLLDETLGLSWDGLFGPAGIVVVGASSAVPLAYLVVAASLASRAEPDLERAARASGATPFLALRTVTLPLARPGVAGAAALVFVSAVNAFEVPAVLGIPAGFATMTTRLYQNLALSADPAAFTSAVALAAALVVLSVAVVGPADALTGAGRSPRTGGPSGDAGAPGRPSWGLAAACWAFIALAEAIPLIALVLVALTRAVGLPPVPANWTLDNFAAALNQHAYAALLNTLLLAVAAATLVLLLGALTAALGRRGPGRPLGTLVTLTFAVSGSALAVAVLLAYGGRLRDTLAIILVAYLAKFWALGHRPLAGAVERLPEDLVRAARVSRAGPVVTVGTVVVPVLRPALLAAWLLVFLFAIHELTISSLLYGPGNETLAVVILNQQQLGDVAGTSALSVLLTVLIAAGAGLLLVARRAATRLGVPS
jgi:iron(III) transport system permease protein